MAKSKVLTYLTELLALTAGVLLLVGCEGAKGPAGPPGPVADASDLSCTQCHNSTSLIPAKMTAWSESLHGAGESYVRGTSRSCAGCHSGAAFQKRVAAGLGPHQLTEGDPEPTRQDCRTCHQLHTTNTAEDWALTTTDPVDLYATNGATFDGGDGNLCVGCHQPRRVFPAAADGVVSGISGHWGPHHGPQSSMLMGLAGAGATGNPSMHYNIVENTCVACHMGENSDHHFEASVDACQACHSGAENFDINGVQTEVQAMLDELGEKLVAAGLIDENSPAGHPIVTQAPTAQAVGLWNWIYVAHEDKSLGVHNPAYTIALLQAGLDAF